MPLTKFPQDTDEPRLDVTLPVGTHVFKLTVIDDAGMRSQPDTVVIRVDSAQSARHHQRGARRRAPGQHRQRRHLRS